MLVAPLAGVTEVTRGARKSTVAPVVKLVFTGGLMATTPVRSVTPVTLKVYTVFGESVTTGMRISVWLPYVRVVK